MIVPSSIVRAGLPLRSGSSALTWTVSSAATSGIAQPKQSSRAIAFEKARFAFDSCIMTGSLTTKSVGCTAVSRTAALPSLSATFVTSKSSICRETDPYRLELSRVMTGHLSPVHRLCQSQAPPPDSDPWRSGIGDETDIPVEGSEGLGGSPANRIRSRRRVGSATGTAESRLTV